MIGVVGFAGKPEHLHPSSVSNSRTDEITRLRADLAAVTEERDRLLEALKSADLMTREIHADLKEKCQRIYDAFYATRAALEGVMEKSGGGNE